MSMTALAERALLSQQIVSYVEREMRNPTFDTVLRITAVLELDLADVIRRASAHFTSNWAANPMMLIFSAMASCGISRYFHGLPPFLAECSVAC